MVGINISNIRNKKGQVIIKNNLTNKASPTLKVGMASSPSWFSFERFWKDLKSLENKNYSMIAIVGQN